MPDQIDFTVADTAPELRNGDSGPWVFYLQQLLEVNERNMTHFNFALGAIDDDFGPNVERAVKAYQAWMPVAQTGVVDAAVWRSLIEGAATFEGIDDHQGNMLEARRGRGGELGAGEEVGRSGWCRVDLVCIVRTFRGNAFPDGTQAYLRFIDEDGAVSDEDARISDGSLRLNDVWVPKRGQFHLYVDSQQPSSSAGWLGTVQGSEPMNANGGSLQFEASQRSGETITLSQEEATSRGWVSTTGSAPASTSRSSTSAPSTASASRPNGRARRVTRSR